RHYRMHPPPGCGPAGNEGACNTASAWLPRQRATMTRLRVSIVLCTYNGAVHLQPQLDSLLAQTRLPDEIVIGDDGSTDASVDMLQAFAVRARDAGIEVQLVRHRENLGYVDNFSA